MNKGRPVLGAFGGLLLGISLALLSLTTGVAALDSPLLVILPVAFLLFGILWALWAPIKRGGTAPPTPPAAPPQQF
jgi:hypothetical protein